MSDKPKSKFDDLTKEQRQHYDRALEIAKGIKDYRTSMDPKQGNPVARAMFTQWQPASEQSLAKGGEDPGMMTELRTL